MRILFVHPSVINDNPQPPLGVAYVASYLESMGKYDVQLLDLGHQSPNRSLDALKDEINKFNPKVMGISFLTTLCTTAMEYFKIAKSLKPDIFTVAGGVHSSALPAEVLSQ